MEIVLNSESKRNRLQETHDETALLIGGAGASVAGAGGRLLLLVAAPRGRGGAILRGPRGGGGGHALRTLVSTGQSRVSGDIGGVLNSFYKHI